MRLRQQQCEAEQSSRAPETIVHPIEEDTNDQNLEPLEDNKLTPMNTEILPTPRRYDIKEDIILKTFELSKECDINRIYLKNIKKSKPRVKVRDIDEQLEKTPLKDKTPEKALFQELEIQ